MEFTVSDEDYITINDETSREILLDEIYLMTNSRKLVDLLKDNINEEYILFRSNSKYDSHKRLLLTHVTFHKHHDYYNITNSKRYTCVGYDEVKNEAMMRLANGHKRDIKYTTDIKKWAIIL